MKACIVLQNQYTKLGHAIVLQLKEKYNITEFSGYIFSQWAKDFIQTQNNIKYTYILTDHELHDLYKKEKLDLDYIKYFEKTYGTPHLWKYLYDDRKLLMSIGPKEETTTTIDPLYSHEDLLKIFQVRAKAIEKMLKETKPDFILFFAISALGNVLLYHIAKKMGIRTFGLDFPRIGNLISLSEDYDTLTGVEENFNIFQKSKENTEYHKRAEKFLENFEKTGSLNLEYIQINPSLNKDTFTKTKSLLRSIKYIITLTKNYLKNRKYFLYGMTTVNPLLFILYKLKFYYRKWQGLDHLYSEPTDEDYAFYPLHFEPELAILLLSPFYFDQIALIRQIARSLPVHYKLYIKEHPAMIFHRSISYYKELLKIPNVKIISHKIKSTELIKKSKLITAITGTVGWEATLLKKPVITFGNVFINILPFVKRIHDIELLPQLIKEQTENFKFNKEELLNFTAAIFKDAFPFNFAGLWYENDIQKIKSDSGTQILCDKIMEKMTKKNE